MSLIENYIYNLICVNGLYALSYVFSNLIILLEFLWYMTPLVLVEWIAVFYQGKKKLNFYDFFTKCEKKCTFFKSFLKLLRKIC